MPGKIKNFTDEFKKQIVSLYHNGKSASKIAEEYGIGKSTVEIGLKIIQVRVYSRLKITVQMKKMNLSYYVYKTSDYLWKIIFK